MSRFLFLAGLLLIVPTSVQPAHAQDSSEANVTAPENGDAAWSEPPSWGDLTAGPHAVGFRVIRTLDRSRGYWPLRDYRSEPNPAPTERPIQIGVWYPAAPGPSAEPMAFRNAAREALERALDLAATVEMPEEDHRSVAGASTGDPVSPSRRRDISPEREGAMLLPSTRTPETMNRLLVAAFVVLVASCVGAEEPPSEPIRVAITLDDLPWVGPLPEGDSANDALMRIAATLRVHAAPATGFVVCDRAREDEQPVTSWAAWGFALGNHSAAHRDLNQTPVEEWLRDVERCDRFLRRFGDATTPYFRFPLLHQGDTAERRDRVRDALQGLGLETAHVTVDGSSRAPTPRRYAPATRPSAARSERNSSATSWPPPSTPTRWRGAR